MTARKGTAAGGDDRALAAIGSAARQIRTRRPAPGIPSAPAHRDGPRYGDRISYTLYMFGGRFPMANRTTYTKARATLASLCDTVAETREPYVIERRNGENVALISEAELNSLLETAHLLRSPRNASRLASALERALGGKPASSSLKQLRRSLGLEDT